MEITFSTKLLVSINLPEVDEYKEDEEDIYREIAFARFHKALYDIKGLAIKDFINLSFNINKEDE